MRRRLIALVVILVVVLSTSLPVLASTKLIAQGFTIYNGTTVKYWADVQGTGGTDMGRAYYIDIYGIDRFGSTREICYGTTPRLYSASFAVGQDILGWGYDIWKKPGTR